MVKKGRKWIIAGVVIVVIVVAVALLSGGKGTTRYAEATASTGTITTYYSFSGNMDVNNSVTVTSPSDTTVSEIYVTPNSTVLKNARLMRLADGTIVKADIAGEVTSIEVAVDSVVKTGATLAEVMELTSMKATFKVDEYDVSAIQIGKAAQLTVDGTGDSFEGKITSINKRATVDGDLSYYIATVDLTGQQVPANAFPGMQITAKVLNKQAENAVLLTMDAVRFTAQNTPYVLMRDGDKVKELSIQVGINDGTNVEITEGLKAGDSVLYVSTANEVVQSSMASQRSSFASGIKEARGQ